MEQEVDVIDLNVAQLNQYNLTRMLDDVVLLDGEQLVLSQLDFYDDLLAEEIWINGSVNGIFTQDMAMAGVEQTFSALQILERPSFAHLKVGVCFKLSIRFSFHLLLVNKGRRPCDHGVGRND